MKTHWKQIIWFLGGMIAILLLQAAASKIHTISTIQNAQAGAAKSIIIYKPRERSVFQRKPNDADIPIAGMFSNMGIRTVEARATVMGGFQGTNTEWETIHILRPGTTFQGTLTVREGGWYKIEVRGLDAAGNITTKDEVERIGVGEIFITLGQSNAANSGLPHLKATADQVSAYNPCTTWEHAQDPQPIATGEMGSPWPALGDLLVERLGVPIGFISVGVGGTSVEEWLPGGNLYPRLHTALEELQPFGFRAILWHQGERDSKLGTGSEIYAERLEAIISKSRSDAGWKVPWGVAIASYVPASSEKNRKAVSDGQRRVIEQDAQVFQGANTDELIGAIWRYDSTHFNETGLRAHARGWAAAIEGWIAKQET